MRLRSKAKFRERLLANVIRRNGENERLWWRGLALTRRDYLNGKEVVSSERYLNEPHPGGGNPVLVWEGKAAPASAKERAKAAATRLLFNDMLGSTISVIDGDRAEATNMTLFGETPDGQGAGFFTGKPHIDELGYAFLFRNYRPEKAKWQTADPLGYPDGWNALAYCGNGAISKIDNLGLAENWFSDDVRYHAHDPKQVFYYGIINDDGIDTVMGTKVLILWTEKIHAVCQICYGPDCSTEECYKTITLRSIVENVEWVAKKLPMTCPTVPADVVVGLGNIILDRILPTDTYWPIDFSKIDRHYQNRVRNAPAPEIRRDSFLGRHCEE